MKGARVHDEYTLGSPVDQVPRQVGSRAVRYARNGGAIVEMVARSLRAIAPRGFFSIAYTAREDYRRGIDAKTRETIRQRSQMFDLRRFQLFAVARVYRALRD